MITTCTKCGRAYDDPSEESANEPNRTCLACKLAALRAENAKLREALEELLGACEWEPGFDIVRHCGEVDQARAALAERGQA